VSGLSAAKLAAAGGDEASFAEDCDFVVASPGVRVMSELEFGCRALRARGVRLLAVTGSKGKSSVVKLLADALTRAGHPATPCGNYGRAVSAVALETPLPEWAVVEVSSFQLETTHLDGDAFEAAAILNLQEDHLDRHGTVAVYHGLKRSLLGMARVALEPESLSRLAAMPAVRALFAGSYFDNAVLAANGAAGVALLRCAGLPDAAIADAFARFEPLAHRMQVVGTFGGVRCIDDSKATSLAALAAGVAMAGGRTRLIAGGLGKGDDPNEALPLLTKGVKKVYLIGACADRLYEAWSARVDCEICETLEHATEAALREVVTGETVLLSPGAASFDQFKNFEERGEVFARLVKREGQKKK